MKNLKEIGEELQLQVRLLWYIDWLKWHRENPIEQIALHSEKQKVRENAMMFADTIDHYHKDEINTRRVAEAGDRDRAKILGLCLGLSWVLDLTLEQLVLTCGPNPDVPPPALNGDRWSPFRNE